MREGERTNATMSLLGIGRREQKGQVFGKESNHLVLPSKKGLQ